MPWSSETFSRKRRVVADDQEGATIAVEALFELFDGRDVEVVGWLVEQQDVRVFGEGAGKRDAARLSAGGCLRIEVCRHAPCVEFGLAKVMDRWVEAGGDDIAGGGCGAEVRLLFEAADGRAGLEEKLSAIRLNLAGEYLQQCGLPCAGCGRRGPCAGPATAPGRPLKRGARRQG